MMISVITPVSSKGTYMFQKQNKKHFNIILIVDLNYLEYIDVIAKKRQVSCKCYCEVKLSFSARSLLSDKQLHLFCQCTCRGL
jgi:hypothetical protein